MKEAEITQKIAECKERKKHYEKMLEWLEDYKLAIVRSITTETYNIAEYKKLRGKQ